MAKLKIKQNEQWVDLGIVDTHNMPAGGTVNQVLTKMSDADYDFAWTDVEAPEGSGGNIPVGAIFPYPDENIPEGFLECNGQTFDKEQYPKLGEICDKHFGIKYKSQIYIDQYENNILRFDSFGSNLSALTVGDLYNITIEGEEFQQQELKKFSPEEAPVPMDIYYFGNLHLVENEMEDTGEDFVWVSMGYGTEVSVPSFYSYVYWRLTEEEAMKKFASKNYALLELDSLKIYCSTFDADDIEDYGSDQNLITDFFPYYNVFTPGEYYDISFNNNFYHSICTECFAYPIKFIGNMALYDSGMEDTGEPFLLTIEDNILWCTSTIAGTIPIELLLNTNVGVLPDLRGVTIAGYYPGSEYFGTIGGVVGQLYHSHYTGGTSLSINQIPSHSHTITKQVDNNSGNSISAGSGSSTLFYQTDSSVTTGTTGGGQSHSHYVEEAPSLQPTTPMVWMVKAAEMPEIEAIVEDTLISESSTNALSARQGKILNEKAIPAGGTEGQVLVKASDGDNDVEWASTPGSVDYTPIGTISPWGKEKAPAGYEICDGRKILKSDYPQYADEFKYTYMPGITYSVDILENNIPAYAKQSKPFYLNSLIPDEYYTIAINGEEKRILWKRDDLDGEFDYWNSYFGFGNFHLIEPELEDTGEDYAFLFSGNNYYTKAVFPNAGKYEIYFPFIQGYTNIESSYSSTVFDAYGENALTEWFRFYDVGDRIRMNIYGFDPNPVLIYPIDTILKEYIYFEEDYPYVIHYVGNLYLFDSDWPNTGEDYVFVNFTSYAGASHELYFKAKEDWEYSNYINIEFVLSSTSNSYPYVFTPDLTGQVIGGYNPDNYDFNILNSSIGDYDHEHYIYGTTLSVNQIPSHTHKLNKRQQWYSADTKVSESTGSIYSWKTDEGGSTSAAYQSNSDDISATGGGQSHNHGISSGWNIQPTFVMNWIIKVATLSRADISDNSKIVNVFSPVKKYNVGDIVLHNKVLYKCKKAVEEPGEWTGIDAINYRPIQIGDNLNGKTIYFNWPVAFNSDSGIFLIVGDIPYSGLVPSGEEDNQCYAVVIQGDEEQTMSDPLCGYTYEETSDPTHWQNWSVERVESFTFGNSVPGLVSYIDPTFTEAFNIKEEYEGNWEIYSDPVVYKLQDENIMTSFYQALQSNSELYSLDPESQGWSGIEEIIAACKAYDNNLYIDTFDHILRIDVSKGLDGVLYVLRITDNTQALMFEDEIKQVSYNGYLFITESTTTEGQSRANFQFYKTPFEPQAATQSNLGGIQLFFDNTTNTLYIANDGSVPGPKVNITLPDSSTASVTQGDTWKHWIESGESETYCNYTLSENFETGEEYVLDLDTGNLIAYNGVTVIATEVFIPNATYEYETPFIEFSVAENEATRSLVIFTGYAPEGSTWGEYIDSPYNGRFKYENNIIQFEWGTDEWFQLYSPSFGALSLTDTIIPNGEYNIEVD